MCYKLPCGYAVFSLKVVCDCMRIYILQSHGGIHNSVDNLKRQMQVDFLPCTTRMTLVQGQLIDIDKDLRFYDNYVITEVFMEQ